MMEENQSNHMPNNELEKNLSQPTEEPIKPDQSTTPTMSPVEVGRTQMDTDNKLFAALSYISILFVIPWVTKKNNPFISFHVKQGMALFVVEVVVWFILWLVGSFLEGIFSYHVLELVQFMYKLAWLVFGVAIVLGVYYALTGKEKTLPYLSIVTKNINL